jgi:hypothetical protein
VLFGQPELDENLRQTQIRQLRERITHSFNLAPLDEEDVRAYLAFRLQAAGYHGPDLFGSRVIRYMTRASGGLTRRINLVADKALLAAFAESTHNVSLKHVKAAVRDSEFSDVPVAKSRSPFAYAAGGLALGGLVGAAAVAGYLALSGPAQEAQPPVAAAAPPEAQVAAVTPPPASAASSPQPATVAAPPAPPPIQPVNAVGLQPTLDDDILEQRLLATDVWLDQAGPGDYSIQLLGTNDPELLREYLKTLSKYVEIEKIYVYRTVANRRPSLTVLYGTFQDRRDVGRALANLPFELQTNQPYYRTIQGIRAEIARNRS